MPGGPERHDGVALIVERNAAANYTGITARNGLAINDAPESLSEHFQAGLLPEETLVPSQVESPASEKARSQHSLLQRVAVHPRYERLNPWELLAKAPISEKLWFCRCQSA